MAKTLPRFGKKYIRKTSQVVSRRLAELKLCYEDRQNARLNKSSDFERRRESLIIWIVT